MASIFGTSDEAWKKSGGKTFTDVITDWGNKTMNDLIKSLQSKVKLTTDKALEQSIQAQPIAFDGKTLSVSITGLPYADFINKGVGGVGGEKGVYEDRMSRNGNVYQYRTGITNWVNKAPTSPFKFKNKKPPTFDNWANLAGINKYVLQEAIYRSGIKANHFIDEVIDEQYEKAFAEAIGNSVSKALEVDIKLDFDGK